MSKIISQKEIENSILFKNGQDVVSSDTLAKMFSKQHKDILKVIRTKIAFFSSENIPLKDFFIEDKTKTSKGKEYSRYFLTRKGFDFVGLSLQGTKADLYKYYYINAFHDKQAILEKHKLTHEQNNQDSLWLIFRDEGKTYRRKLTDSIDEYITKPRAEVEKKYNDGKYYYHYTTLIYKKLNTEIPKGVNARDVLDKRNLVRLEDMEDQVAEWIKQGAESGKHYKEVYRDIKERLV